MSEIANNTPNSKDGVTSAGDGTGGGGEGLANTTKKRRIRFNAELDVILPKSMLLIDGHFSGHEKSKMLFGDALASFKVTRT